MTKPFSLEEIRRAEEARKAPHVLDEDLRCPDCKRVTPHRFEYIQVQTETADEDAPLYATTGHTCLKCKQTHTTHVDRSKRYPEKDLLKILMRRAAFSALSGLSGLSLVPSSSMEHVQAAERKLMLYLHQFPGFLGLKACKIAPGHSVICVRWLEKTEIPKLPAVVNNVRIVVMPTALESAVVSGWLDRWKGEFSDAWEDYKQTLHELATGHE